jgi:iron uptake system component EfeO
MLFAPRPLIAPLVGVAALALSLSACGSDDATTDPTELTTAQQAMVATAGAEYAHYVQHETEHLLEGTRAFVAAYKAGQDDRARALYAPTRANWEAIEPVAETFGDLDPRTDAREADLEAGQEWTGWHLIEKDLWPADAGADYVALTAAQRTTYADKLLSDLAELEGQVADASYTGEQIANGAKELLDEVANGKITGEEEIWSHTDLFDFQANVDGARKAFDVLQPVVEQTDPELGETLTTRFAELQDLLDAQRKGDGFVSYTALSTDQVKALSDAVNALSEPLAQLATAVASGCTLQAWRCHAGACSGPASGRRVSGPPASAPGSRWRPPTTSACRSSASTSPAS